MGQFWEAIAARTNVQHTAEEFEAAAYRLVSEQVIYHSDRHSRAAYWIVDRYEREINQAVAPLGVIVEVNRQLRYAYAIPKHEKSGSASIAQTVLALVLRAIYDESARIGQLTDNGEVVCDLVELEEKYRLMVGRELPSKRELDSLMKSMKRWGIAKRSDELSGYDANDLVSTQPYAIVIRPAIIDVLGETALLKLAQWYAPNTVGVATEKDDESEEKGAVEK